MRSGVVVAGDPLELLATAAAAESTYAGVVRLVEQAQAAGAPFVRLADRLATSFVPLTVLLAGGAWLLSGQAVRAVAVLVVATPCPLLLAAPIAIISGLSGATRVGVIVKGGGALERLAAARVGMFDKTGTLTLGRPQVTDVLLAPAGPPAPELLQLAASLDQLSPHVLAAGIVAAGARGPRAARRARPASGKCTGTGSRASWKGAGCGSARRRGSSATRCPTGRDRPAGGPSWTARSRCSSGWTASRPVRCCSATRSAPTPAGRCARCGPPASNGSCWSRATGPTSPRPSGELVGVDEVLAECDPAAKLAAVRAESAAAPTLMVGDGVNDAPALAAAGAGVALAARGASASSEAADVVLTVDRVDALADAMLVARRAKRIAWRAVVTGMLLSLAAMGLAAAGLLAPAVGAVLQEGIDVLAIGIALTAVLPAPRHTVTMTRGRPRDGPEAARGARGRAADRRAAAHRRRRTVRGEPRPGPRGTSSSSGWRANCCRTRPRTSAGSCPWSTARSATPRPRPR